MAGAVALPSAGGGAGVLRFAANVAGAAVGLWVYDRWLDPAIPDEVFGISTVRGPGLDLGDFFAGASALLGAMLANNLFSALQG
jgi:hypothetical protein